MTMAACDPSARATPSLQKRTAIRTEPSVRGTRRTGVLEDLVQEELSLSLARQREGVFTPWSSYAGNHDGRDDVDSLALVIISEDAGDKCKSRVK